MAWQFCPGCERNNPIPGCPLCEQLNGRPMTSDEDAKLIAALRQIHARLTGGAEDAWLDVPFEDGTTPRERGIDA